MEKSLCLFNTWKEYKKTFMTKMLNLPILIYLNSPFYYFQMVCTRSFKWPSKQRCQCPIPQGTLHPFWFIMWKILSSLFFLGLQLFNSNNSIYVFLQQECAIPNEKQYIFKIIYSYFIFLFNYKAWKQKQNSDI